MAFKSLVLGATLATSLAIPALGHAKSLEDLLVEKGVITRAEASSNTAAAGAKILYKGGTRFEFPDSGFTSQFNTQIQSRYVYTDNDKKDDTSSFEMRRVRLIVSGTALHNEFNYFLQADFVGTKNEDGARVPDVRDAYIQWNPSESVGLRMGQFKVFVSRQESNSSSKLQFADRSVASNLFELGRQGGLSGRYTGMDGNLFLGAGIWNGESDGEGRNKPGTDTRHTGAVTARYTAIGKMDAMEEGDLSHTESAALNFGFAYAYGQTNEGGDKIDKHTVDADVNLKYQGASVHSEFFYRKLNADGSSESVEPLAFYLQGGYFVVPEKVELAARYGFADCDDGAFDKLICSGNGKVQQVTAGVNYFFWKHSLKAQLNWDWIRGEPVDESAEDVDTNRIIFQVSSLF